MRTVLNIWRGKTLPQPVPGPIVRLQITQPPGRSELKPAASAEVARGLEIDKTQAGSFDNVMKSSLARPVEPAPAKEQWFEYTIKKNDTLWDLAVNRFHVNVQDLIQDNNIQDPRKIQPGQKIRVRVLTYPEQTQVTASWYGQDYHGRAMANGQPFDMHAATIAHKELPLGTRVELENPVTGVSVKAVVTDRGPYIKGRDVDLSYGLAQKLSLVEKGVGPLVMKVIG